MGQCQQLLDSDAGAGSCQNVSATLQLFFVPQPPTQPHLQFADGFRGLFLFTPGVDTVKRDLLCLVGEIYSDMYRNPANGDLWVVGLPNFVFNPVTLDFAIFDNELTAANGGTRILPSAVAVDPIDGTLLLGLNNTNALRRFNRPAGTLTTILNSSSIGSARDILIKPDGTAVIMASSGTIYHFDARTGPFPVNPATFVPVAITPPQLHRRHAGTFQGSFVNQLVSAPGGNASFIYQTLFGAGSFFNSVYALYDLDLSTYSPTLVHRAVASSGFVSPTFAILFGDIGNAGVARSSDRLYLLPFGSFNTNILGIEFGTPPTIPINSANAPFSVGAVEYVDPATTPTCAAEFNGDGSLNPDDLGDFINCYFAEISTPGDCPAADFNHDGSFNPDDLGDYINAYFAGCP